MLKSTKQANFQLSSELGLQNADALRLYLASNKSISHDSDLLATHLSGLQFPALFGVGRTPNDTVTHEDFVAAQKEGDEWEQWIEQRIAVGNETSVITKTVVGTYQGRIAAQLGQIADASATLSALQLLRRERQQVAQADSAG